MQDAPTFEKIKRDLDSFDQNILTRWMETVEVNQNPNVLDYILDVPGFPVEPQALVARSQLGELSLKDIVACPDAACETLLDIPLEDMRMKFGFEAKPTDRPRVVVKKTKKTKKSKDKDKDKKDKKSHGKRNPGDPPRSESAVFSTKKH